MSPAALGKKMEEYTIILPCTTPYDCNFLVLHLLADVDFEHLDPFFWANGVTLLLMDEILHQLKLVVFPIIYKALCIPGSCLGFLPSTGFYHESWDKFSCIHYSPAQPFIHYMHVRLLARSSLIPCSKTAALLNVWHVQILEVVQTRWWFQIFLSPLFGEDFQFD